MLKLIFCYNRKAGLSVPDFQRHFLNDRLDLVRSIPGLERYEQNHAKPSSYNQPAPPIFDGVEKMWIETQLSPAELLATPALKSARDALADIVDAGRVRHIVAQEAVIKDGPAPEGTLRLIEFLTRKDGMSPPDFHAHWEKVHGPLVAKQPQIRRYVQSHTLMSEYADGQAPDFDGVTEVWFENTAAMREAVAAPLWAEVLEDEENFVPKNTPFILSIDRTVVLEA